MRLDQCLLSPQGLHYMSESSKGSGETALMLAWTLLVTCATFLMGWFSWKSSTLVTILGSETRPVEQTSVPPFCTWNQLSSFKGKVLCKVLADGQWQSKTADARAYLRGFWYFWLISSHISNKLLSVAAMFFWQINTAWTILVREGYQETISAKLYWNESSDFWQEEFWSFLYIYIYTHIQIYIYVKISPDPFATMFFDESSWIEQS